MLQTLIIKIHKLLWEQGKKHLPVNAPIIRWFCKGSLQSHKSFRFTCKMIQLSLFSCFPPSQKPPIVPWIVGEESTTPFQLRTPETWFYHLSQNSSHQLFYRRWMSPPLSSEQNQLWWLTILWAQKNENIAVVSLLQTETNPPGRIRCAKNKPTKPDCSGF